MEQPFPYALLTLRNLTLAWLIQWTHHIQLEISLYFHVHRSDISSFVFFYPEFPVFGRIHLPKQLIHELYCLKWTKQESKCQGHISKQRQTLFRSLEQLWAHLHCICRQVRTTHMWDPVDNSQICMWSLIAGIRGRFWTSEPGFLCQALAGWSPTPILQSAPYTKYNHVLRSVYIPRILIFQN